MTKLVNMELDDDDSLDAPDAIKPLKPTHPWGLRINLLKRDLDKLGLSHEGVKLGEIVHGFFMASVTHVSHSVDETGEDSRIELQIEHLKLEDEDEESEEELEK